MYIIIFTTILILFRSHKSHIKVRKEKKKKDNTSGNACD